MRFLVSLCLLCALCLGSTLLVQAQDAAATPSPAPAVTPSAAPSTIPLLLPSATPSVPPSTDAVPEASPSPETKMETSVGGYLIGLGDTLDVMVERRPELGWRGQVNGEGNIPALPYLEKQTRALCRTTDEIAREIAEAYSKLIKNSVVTVRVIERSTRPAILLGAIRTPQRFQMGRDVRLNELLFISGGITDRASGDIQIFTAEPAICPAPVAEGELPVAPKSPIKIVKILDLMSGAEDANPLIRPGDIVTIMVAEPVYVIGGVAAPQGINFREQLTLSRAISTVGGFSSGARSGEIRIYRRKPDALEQEVIKADYDAIRKKQQPDIALKPYDIIEVPRSSGSPTRGAWQSAAQEIITDEKQSAALPLRVLN